MIDQPLASRFAREGFELWEAGKLDESCACYVKALELADPNHWALPEYHGEFAGVLGTLGKVDEATSQYEKAIAIQLAHGETQSSSGVLLYHYFLADHLTRNGAADKALSTLVPALCAAPEHWLISLAHAEALFALGQTIESRVAAERAIANAPTAEKSAELAQHLSAILGASHGAAG